MRTPAVLLTSGVGGNWADLTGVDWRLPGGRSKQQEIQQWFNPAAFKQNVDAAAGRVDMTFLRGQDMVGASGTGLVGVLMIEPVAQGTLLLSANGAGTGPAGSAISIQSTPVSVTVK
jgi:hypothetical protein